MHLGAERRRPSLPGRIVLQQLGVVQLQHAGAGARRRHHVVVGLEGGDRLARQLLRGRLVAGVVGRLAAAGLRRRHVDIAAGVGQQLDRRKADRGAEQVDEAGDEQTDARAPFGRLLGPILAWLLRHPPARRASDDYFGNFLR